MTDDILTEGDTREARRLRYEFVLDLVRRRTGEGMPATIPRGDLTGRLHQRGLTADDMDSTIKAAKQNDALIEIAGPDGIQPHLALNEHDAVRAVAIEEANRDNPRIDLIGRLNERVEALKDDATIDD